MAVKTANMLFEISKGERFKYVVRLYGDKMNIEHLNAEFGHAGNDLLEVMAELGLEIQTYLDHMEKQGKPIL